MNFGSRMRGYASLSNDTDSYFNQWLDITPKRNGPVLCRIKPKVDTDQVDTSLMDRSGHQSRIELWPISKGDHTQKLNIGSQILNLTSTTGNPNPTIPRKLEDNDYRCLDAKIRQEDLLPLSRLPRQPTSILSSKGISEVFTKPVNPNMDFSGEEIRSIIHGKLNPLKNTNKQLTIDTPDDRDGKALYGYIASRKKLEVANKSNKSLVIDGSTSGQTNSNAKIIQKLKGYFDPTKILTIYGSNTSQTCDLAKIIKKIVSEQIESGCLLNIPGLNAQQKNFVIREVNKLKAIPRQHLVQIIYKTDHPDLFLVKKIHVDKLGATKNVNVITESDRNQPNNKKLPDKITPDPANAKKQIAVETASGKTQPNTAKNVERVKVNSAPTVQYKVGHRPNMLRNEQNLQLQYKNQFVGKQIDVERYSPYVPRFERGIDTNMPFSYGDRPPPFFLKTNSY